MLCKHSEMKPWLSFRYRNGGDSAGHGAGPIREREAGEYRYRWVRYRYRATVPVKSPKSSTLAKDLATVGF